MSRTTKYEFKQVHRMSPVGAPKQKAQGLFATTLAGYTKGGHTHLDKPLGAPRQNAQALESYVDFVNVSCFRVGGWGSAGSLSLSSSFCRFTKPLGPLSLCHGFLRLLGAGKYDTRRLGRPSCAAVGWGRGLWGHVCVGCSSIGGWWCRPSSSGCGSVIVVACVDEHIGGVSDVCVCV